MNTNVLTNNEEIITFAAGLAEAWKAKFEVRPQFNFNFDVKNGVLRFNEEDLCPVDKLDMDKSTYDTEWIMFYLTTGEGIFIHIIWTFEGIITTEVERIPAELLCRRAE